jgi:hypothetical protein
VIEVWRHHRVIGNVVVFSLVGVFLVLLLTNVARTGDLVSAIRETQKSNTGLTRETHSTTDLIRSCVDPSGRCFKRGQRRTAQAVADINRVIVLAAACSVGVPPSLSVADRQVAIQSCVIDRLAARRPR